MRENAFRADSGWQICSQPESITQKGVHIDPLTAREREHWILQHLSHCELGFREHSLGRCLGVLPNVFPCCEEHGEVLGAKFKPQFPEKK